MRAGAKHEKRGQAMVRIEALLLSTKSTGKR